MIATRAKFWSAGTSDRYLHELIAGARLIEEGRVDQVERDDEDSIRHADRSARWNNEEACRSRPLSYR